MAMLKLPVVSLKSASLTDGRVPREIPRGDTVLECALTDRRVAVADGVFIERTITDCRIVDSFGVGIER